MRCRLLRVTLLATALFALTSAHSQTAPTPAIPYPPAVTASSLDRHTLRVTPPEMIAPGQYRIGEIHLNRGEKSLSFPAVVNMSSGLLEYVLVAAGGKTHESLLRTGIEPYNLHVACLLLGFEGSDTPLAYQGDAATPRGDAIEIELRLADVDGKPRLVKPEAWIAKVVGDARSEASALKWVFTGSVVGNGRFAAQASGSIVALYHDPAAMVDNASPGGESDKIWFVREGATPPVGTPVTVTLRAKK